MATKLTCLSDEAIGLIFDLLDSRSLFRALIVGNALLSNKVKRSVRRFTHETGYSARFAAWPNFSGFLALEHVSVSSKDPEEYSEAAMMHGVDLLTLPSTLRTLELYFLNGLLCLVTLPPVKYTGGPFTPRLRQDIKDHFKNLETLSWIQSEDAWDMSEFEEDLIRWPLNSWTPMGFIPLSRALTLPSTALCLNVQLPNGTIDLEEPKLPSSLQKLHISKRVDSSSNVMASDLSILSGLFQLTSLNFSPTVVDITLLLALPRTLLHLNLDNPYANVEVESLAHLPTELTSLNMDYGMLHSSTTGESRSVYQLFGEGLPTSFLPSMRTTVVEKLPAKLKYLSLSIWELIRPEDWDAFPSKNAALSSSFSLQLAPCHIPYIPHLPRYIPHVNVPQNCTIELAAALPRTLTALELDFLKGLHLETVFKTLPHRIWMLQELTLSVDDSFEFGLLHHLNAPCLRDLTVRSKPLHQIPILAHNSEIPSCFGTLHRLFLDAWCYRALSGLFVRVLKTCSELKELIFEEVTDGEPFREEWVPFLPPKLERLSVPMDRVECSTFARLPRSLTILNVHAVPGHVSIWDFVALAQLPKRISSVCIPYHNVGKVQEDDIRANLNEVAANLLSDPYFGLCVDTTGQFWDYNIISRPPDRPKLLNMLGVERISRAVHTNDDLPAPRRRMKRKAEK